MLTEGFHFTGTVHLKIARNKLYWQLYWRHWLIIPSSAKSKNMFHKFFFPFNLTIRPSQSKHPKPEHVGHLSVWEFVCLNVWVSGFCEL